MKIRRDKADSLFSKYLREKRGSCQRCGRTTTLQISHFWGRRHENTRFDEENCDVFCYACHRYFHENPAEYVAWKKKQLGEKRFKDLEIRAHLYKRKDRKLDYIVIKKLYEDFKRTNK